MSGNGILQSLYASPTLGQLLVDLIGVQSREERGMVFGRYAETYHPFSLLNTPQVRTKYILNVRTSQGACRVEVSKLIYEKTHGGDAIILRYKVGRYSKQLRGKRL